MKREDPGLIPAPDLTTADLAVIVQRCSVIQQGQEDQRVRRFDGEWLLNNVGRRIVHVDRNRSVGSGPQVRLVHRNITQDDFGCADDLWKTFSPIVICSDF